MERFTPFVFAGTLLCLSVILPADVWDLRGQALALRCSNSHVSMGAAQTQTSESALPPETRAQIDKLASRAAKELRKHRKGAAGWKLLVMDFPVADSGKTTELGVLLADEFSDSLSRQAEGFAVLSRSQIMPILKDEEIPRESLQGSEIGLYVATKAGADEPLKGFLVRGTDGNLILSLSVFGQRMERVDATLTTTDGMRELLAKEIRSPEPRADTIEPEPSVFVPEKDGVTYPTCVYCPSPQYSDLARKMHYSTGSIRLSVVVTAEGRSTIRTNEASDFCGSELEVQAGGERRQACTCADLSGNYVPVGDGGAVERARRFCRF